MKTPSKNEDGDNCESCNCKLSVLEGNNIEGEWLCDDCCFARELADLDALEDDSMELDFN